MKKWLIMLSCLLVAAAVAIAAILNNSNTRISTLNQDLYDAQTEVDTLKKKAEEDKDTIQNLNQQIDTQTQQIESQTQQIENQNQQIENQTRQIEGQNQQIDNLNTEKEALTAENMSLNESLENVNRDFSYSQQKLQGVLYILTDGEQGNIEGLLSPVTKNYQDVSMENPYYEAVNYVTEHQLMIPREEGVFGAEEQATLGDLGEGWQTICNMPGTRAEAAASLLKTEKAWLESKAESEDKPVTSETAENEETTDETPFEPAAEEPAEETEAEPVTEEPVEEAEAEPATEEPVEEAEAELAAEEPMEETESEPAAEELAEEAEAEPVAEEPVEETEAESTVEEPVVEAEAESTVEEPVEEAEAEPVAEEPVEEAEAEPAAEETEKEAIAEDENLVLTRERLLSFCEAICYENSWELPEIILPESGAAEASRGDLAIVLMKLDQIEK